MGNEILGIRREYVCSTYCKHKGDKSRDILAVKEILHHPDGRTQRQFKIIENYKRPYYITKQSFRNHTQKKEFEYLDKVDVFYSTQAQLPRAVFRQLNGFNPSGYVNMYELGNNPYVYGTDVATPVLLAQEYKEQYPNLISESSLAVMDFEWSVINGTTEILSGVLSFKDKVHISVTKAFLGDLAANAKELFFIALERYLGDIVKERNITVTFTIVETTGKLVQALMKSAHEWQPDFVGFWNMSGDIEKMLEALEQDDIDPALVFCDPSIPDEYKFFKWKKDNPVKTTASGKQTPKHIADLWHTVTAPASFYCVCLMATHRLVRARDQYRNDYKLNSVLNDFLQLGKLRFDGIAENLPDLDWHKEMQQKFKIEYLVYMFFDGVGVEMLDEKTGDIKERLRGIIDVSELSSIKSTPKRLADDMHFAFLKDGKVIGSTGSNMEDEFTKYLPTLNDWIICLPFELEHNIGRKLINEYPHLQTNITAHAFDVDVEGAYPTSEICLNISKATRILELCKIEGLSTIQQRELGINLTNANNNSLSLAQMGYGFPQLPTLLEKFKQSKGLV